MIQGVTQLPLPLKESELVVAMDCHGTGTDASIPVQELQFKQKEQIDSRYSDRVVY